MTNYILVQTSGGVVTSVDSSFPSDTDVLVLDWEDWAERGLADEKYTTHQLVSMLNHDLHPLDMQRWLQLEKLINRSIECDEFSNVNIMLNSEDVEILEVVKEENICHTCGLTHMVNIFKDELGIGLTCICGSTQPLI